jgi:AcrR family transcriptional regulator
MMAPPVSRETHLPLRQYRQKRGDKTRERLIEAVIEFAKAGRFRVTTRQLGQYAGVHHTAVNRHFGAIHLLYRVVARERWQEIPLPAGNDHRALAWAILVGEPRNG